MEKKGVVAHRNEGRKFVYHPTVTEEQVRRSMVDELTERVFAGNATALVAHLVAEQEIDAEELEKLKQLIRQHEEKEER
jgi:predicted transcriptional regulator